MKCLLLCAASLFRGLSWMMNLPARFVAIPAAQAARWCEAEAYRDEVQ